MSELSTTWLEGHIVEEDTDFTLSGLCRATGASESQLLAVGVGRGFRDAGRRAADVAGDFEINPSGIALALDLLDEIDALRARITRS
jgi:chaperone modulatory protein CbpM